MTEKKEKDLKLLGPGLGKILTGDLTPEIRRSAYREMITNGCDAIWRLRRLLKKDGKELKKSDWTVIVTTQNGPGDLECEDMGDGITDLEDFETAGHYRTYERSPTEQDGPGGYLGIGKHQPLALSQDRLVEFHSNTEKVGMIVMMHQRLDGSIYFDDPPDYRNSYDVLPHRGCKVIVRNVLTPMTVNRLIMYAARRFVLKIARGYKIIIRNRETNEETLLRAPEDFDVYADTLFTMDDGTPVYGNIKEVERDSKDPTYKGNFDIFKDEIFIEEKDFEYLASGWINCNALLVTASKESLRTGEETPWEEFCKKLRKYLDDNGFKKRAGHKDRELRNQRQLEKYATEAINLYFQQNPDETIPFFPGIKKPVGPPGLSSDKVTWNTLKNQQLVKTDNPEEAIDAKRVNTGGDGPKPGPGPTGVITTKIKRKKAKGTGIIKIPVGGKQETEIELKLRFIPLLKTKDLLPIYWDANEGAFIINTGRNCSVMFKKMESDAVRNEIVRAIMRITPENQNISAEEFDKKFYRTVDAMSESENKESTKEEN